MELAQTIQPQAPKSRSVLLRELRKVAKGPSEDFWIWYWMQEKRDRMWLLNAMEPAQGV